MIYHLLDEAEPFSESKGGAISRWAANVLRDGTEIVVCPSFDASWGYPPERIWELTGWERTRYPVHALLYRLPWVLQRPVYRYILKELMERLQPGDVLYIHNRAECAGPLAALAERRGIQLVLHMHNSLLLRASRGQIRALKRVPIVFVSEFLKREAETAYPGHFEKTFRVYNGADQGTFFSSISRSSKVPTVVFSGRVVPIKGVHVLLRAMRILEQRGVEASCKIIGAAGFGKGKRSRYFEKLQRMRASNTEFVGYLSGEEFAAVLRHADIFCAPSVWPDPFPLAPLEAMASGLPVVASAVGGIPEALAYGGGVLVPEGSPEALADALQNLIEDPAKLRQMSADAVEAFRTHFLWSHVRQQYEYVLGALAQ